FTLFIFIFEKSYSLIMSSKVVSYYDWSLGFKKNQPKINHEKNNQMFKKVNSLGIPQDQFREYLKRWKERNFR
ncbi:MAG: hypothetical protein ACTSRH_02315, partial [Promethearchaeota archaeon]